MLVYNRLVYARLELAIVTSIRISGFVTDHSVQRFSDG
jgi:hypothetical protein